MAASNLKHAIAACLLFAATMAWADQAPLKTNGAFTIEVKASAAEQFAYASRITAESTDPSERHLRVLQSVAALEVIPKRWSADRDMTLRAYREMVARLSGSNLHGNAIKICDKAIAFAGKSPEAKVFLASKGRSLMWLNRQDEARTAFDAATTGDFNKLADFDKNAVLIDATLFYEQAKKFDVAAKHARSRAKVTSSELGRAEALRKALELSMKANDKASAIADLASLSHAALNARMRSLTPDEQEVLARIDASIAEYRKKLGV